MQRYAITDRSLLPASPGHAALRAQVEHWVAGGVDWVQLREKDLPGAELVRLTQLLATVTREPGSRTRLLVNGLQPQQAAAAGAHGVHLAGGATAELVAPAVQTAGQVTVSCHTLPEVEAACAGGAAAILWAPVFEKVLSAGGMLPGTGLAALNGACACAHPVPVFALGGVSAANAPLCQAAGASGVAGIRLFLSEDWQDLA